MTMNGVPDGTDDTIEGLQSGTNSSSNAVDQVVNATGGNSDATKALSPEQIEEARQVAFPGVPAAAGGYDDFDKKPTVVMTKTDKLAFAGEVGEDESSDKNKSDGSDIQTLIHEEVEIDPSDIIPLDMSEEKTRLNKLLNAMNFEIREEKRKIPLSLTLFDTTVDFEMSINIVYGVSKEPGKAQIVVPLSGIQFDSIDLMFKIMDKFEGLNVEYNFHKNKPFIADIVRTSVYEKILNYLADQSVDNTSKNRLIVIKYHTMKPEAKAHVLKSGMESTQGNFTFLNLEKVPEQEHADRLKIAQQELLDYEEKRKVLFQCLEQINTLYGTNLQEKDITFKYDTMKLNGRDGSLAVNLECYPKHLEINFHDGNRERTIATSPSFRLFAPTETSDLDKRKLHRITEARLMEAFPANIIMIDINDETDHAEIARQSGLSGQRFQIIQKQRGESVQAEGINHILKDQEEKIQAFEQADQDRVAKLKKTLIPTLTQLRGYFDAEAITEEEFLQQSCELLRQSLNLEGWTLYSYLSTLNTYKSVFGALSTAALLNTQQLRDKLSKPLEKEQAFERFLKLGGYTLQKTFVASYLTDLRDFFDITDKSDDKEIIQKIKNKAGISKDHNIKAEYLAKIEKLLHFQPSITQKEPEDLHTRELYNDLIIISVIREGARKNIQISRKEAVDGLVDLFQFPPNPDINEDEKRKTIYSFLCKETIFKRLGHIGLRTTDKDSNESVEAKHEKEAWEELVGFIPFEKGKPVAPKSDLLKLAYLESVFLQQDVIGFVQIAFSNNYSVHVPVGIMLPIVPSMMVGNSAQQNGKPIETKAAWASILGGGPYGFNPNIVDLPKFFRTDCATTTGIHHPHGKRLEGLLQLYMPREPVTDSALQHLEVYDYNMELSGLEMSNLNANGYVVAAKIVYDFMVEALEIHDFPDLVSFIQHINNDTESEDISRLGKIECFKHVFRTLERIFQSRTKVLEIRAKLDNAQTENDRTIQLNQDSGIQTAQQTAKLFPDYKRELNREKQLIEQLWKLVDRLLVVSSERRNKKTYTVSSEILAESIAKLFQKATNRELISQAKLAVTHPEQLAQKNEISVRTLNILNEWHTIEQGQIRPLSPGIMEMLKKDVFPLLAEPLKQYSEKTFNAISTSSMVPVGTQPFVAPMRVETRPNSTNDSQQLTAIRNPSELSPSVPPKYDSRTGVALYPQGPIEGQVLSPNTERALLEKVITVLEEHVLSLKAQVAKGDQLATVAASSLQQIQRILADTELPYEKRIQLALEQAQMAHIFFPPQKS